MELVYNHIVSEEKRKERIRVLTERIRKFRKECEYGKMWRCVLERDELMEVPVQTKARGTLI